MKGIDIYMRNSYPQLDYYNYLKIYYFNMYILNYKIILLNQVNLNNLN